MQIRVASENDRERWDRYVLDHAEATPFHLIGWSRAAARAFRHEEMHLLAEQDERVCGVLPLVHLRSILTGSRLISTPFAGHGGPLADDAMTADALVRGAMDLTDSLDAGHLELHFQAHQELPEAALEHLGSDRHLSFRRLLPESEEEIVASMHRDSRRLVRKGASAGLRSHAVSAAPGDHAAPFDRTWLHQAHALVARTMAQLGSPCYSRSYLLELLEHDPERWFAWCTYDGSHLVAVTWVACHGDFVYPQVAGADAAYRRVGANNFHYLKLMSHAVARGIRGFDFGRSKVGSGPVLFKRNFGFEGRPVAYRYYLSGAGAVPNNSPSNGRYAMAVSLWRRLPFPVTKTLGPSLVGHFA